MITATERARRLAADEPLTILDVRWQLAEPDGRAAYEHGHLPGAGYVSLEDEVRGHGVSGGGRPPPPPRCRPVAASRRPPGGGACEKRSPSSSTTTGIAQARPGRGGC